jgi:hypothetical protein
LIGNPGVKGVPPLLVNTVGDRGCFRRVKGICSGDLLVAFIELPDADIVRAVLVLVYGVLVEAGFTPDYLQGKFAVLAKGPTYLFLNA